MDVDEGYENVILINVRGTMTVAQMQNYQSPYHVYLNVVDGLFES